MQDCKDCKQSQALHYSSFLLVYDCFTMQQAHNLNQQHISSNSNILNAVFTYTDKKIPSRHTVGRVRVYHCQPQFLTHSVQMISTSSFLAVFCFLAVH